MKKLIYILCAFLSITTYGQAIFDEGIQNTAAGTANAHTYIVSQDADGLYTKTESVMNQNANTGLLLGGVISVNADPTKWNLAFGEGYVADPLNGTVAKVAWGTQSALTTPYLTTSTATYVLIANAGSGIGSVLMQNTPPTQQQYRTHVYLGKLAHTTKTTILFAVPEPSRMFDAVGQIMDLNSALKSMNVEGNTLSANGANLNLNISSGKIYRAGANYASDRNNPSLTTLSSGTAITFRNKFRDGSGGWTAVNTSTVDADHYDDGTGILATVANNKYTVRVAWRFGGTGTVHLDYGQAVYDNLAAAKSSIPTATVVKDPDNVKDAVIIGWIIVKKGTTALNNTSENEFLRGGMFGESALSAGGTTTMQGAYNNSVSPQIVTSTTGGAVYFKEGTGNNANNVLGVQNGAGTNTFAVAGDGNITGGTYNGYVPEKPAIKSNESLSGAKRKGDVLYGIIDQYTGEEITLSKVTGTPTVDGVIYFQLGSEYFKRDNLEQLNIKWFGAKGDALYNTSGDPSQLASGTYDTSAFITSFSKFTDFNYSKTGGNNLKIPLGNYRLLSSLLGISATTNNTFLEGEGYGNTSVHFERDSDTQEKAIVFSKASGTASERLIRGGGVKNLTFKTNNSNVIRYGLQLDYVEYMNFENVTFEGFYNSSLFGGIWESSFSNITFRGCGAGLADGLVGTVPTWGVLDFDSHISLPFRDASNNSTFYDLNFSSCFGTLIRSVAYANTNVNLNFISLKGESANFDAGAVDELPTFYFDRSSNININGGFYTQNGTGATRNGVILKIGNDISNGLVSFSNFSFNQNNGAAFSQISHQRLKSIIELSGDNSSLALINCTLNDPSNSVGMTSGGYLIDGSGYLNIKNLIINVKTGTRNLSNIINPAISVEGDLTIRYYDSSGWTGVYENFTYSRTQTTSAGTYDFLTRNTSTGVVEKVLSNTIATIISPALTGTPTAPTATAGTNTTQIATTAFTQQELSARISGTPEYLAKFDTGNSLEAGSFSVDGGVMVYHTTYTVATLPTPSGRAFAVVTDATAPTYLGNLTGGGSVVCPVFYNGSAWVSH